MALKIICDKVHEDETKGIFIGYFYVVDDTNPGTRLKETTVQGATQAEVQAALMKKYETWREIYDRQQLLTAIGNTVAQAVMDAVEVGVIK